MASMGELYRNNWILTNAKEEDLTKHKCSYLAILDGINGGLMERKLAARLIPKFYKLFPDLSAAAFRTQLYLCNDIDTSVRHQALRGLTLFATEENLPCIADVLMKLLKTDNMPELDLANNALLHILKIDAKGTLRKLIYQIRTGKDIVRERAINFLSLKLKTLPEEVMTKKVEKLILSKSKKVLKKVNGDQYLQFIKILSSFKSMQNDSGRQLLIDLVSKLHESLNLDVDYIDHLIE
ncbi:apoptosis inhibitor 5 isoform X2 [Pelobates cultripes]|uniref:Apoptosis inhibitor 5 isoform X2 n=1 Tax=Pelobates cultripes TaxID=61616 RepID=A0AAD1RAS2_PELCU|nr:apoptosis inhibitor 5 isoform X2 [Pelobates cultripes]